MSNLDSVSDAGVARVFDDPILMEILRGRFDFIANEMELTLLKSSYSPLIKEARDATAALFDADGRVLAQAEALPVHLGVLIAAMQRVVAAYPKDQAVQGDLYIYNDPYEGGTHLPDILVAAPVFLADRVVGYTATLCHHSDVGGSAPGSTAPSAVDLHAEGLRIPLMKLFDAGVRNDVLYRVIAANIRVPEDFFGDLDAQIASCSTGARRLTELYEEYGLGMVSSMSADLMDYAELSTRQAIAALPDGTYGFTDYLDDDGMGTGPIPIKVVVRITGDEIDFDFTGSAGQVKGAINCVSSSTLSAVYCAIRCITGADIPNNEGCYRPISVTLPERSIVNSAYPAPVGSRAITLKRISDVLFGALAKASPDVVPAASSGQTNILYVGGIDKETGKNFVGFLGVPLPGGMGARPHLDGIDVVETDVTNNMHYPTERCEAELPMRINYIRLWRDSGGAGKYRGGLGYKAEVAWLGDDALVTMRRDRHSIAPWGLQGGGPSLPCRALVIRPDGTRTELGSKGVFPIGKGDLLTVWTSGGGGHGDPFTRAPDAVLRDVADGRVSHEQAESAYGVAIVDGIVDEGRTRSLRSRGGIGAASPVGGGW